MACAQKWQASEPVAAAVLAPGAALPPLLAPHAPVRDVVPQSSVGAIGHSSAPRERCAHGGPRRRLSTHSMKHGAALRIAALVYNVYM